MFRFTKCNAGQMLYIVEHIQWKTVPCEGLYTLTVFYHHQNEPQTCLFDTSSDKWLNFCFAHHNQHYHLHKQTNKHHLFKQSPMQNPDQVNVQLFKISAYTNYRWQGGTLSFEGHAHFALSLRRYLNLLMTCYAHV